MSDLADVVAVAPSWRPAVRDRPRASVKSRGESNAQITYWVKQGELDDALEIVDGVDEIFTIGGASITRKVPLRHPRWNDMLADGSDIEEYWSPEAATTPYFTGPQAKVTVRFVRPPFPIDGATPYMQVSTQPGQRELRIPAGVGALASGSGSGTYFQPIPFTSYQLSVFKAPDVDEAQELAWVNAGGYVNSTTFRGQAAGTVLMHAPRFEYKTEFDGTQTCNYTLNFDVCRVPWNKEYNTSGSLQDMTVGGTARHPTMDLNTLFV
jgi:hypothetical protein